MTSILPQNRKDELAALASEGDKSLWAIGKIAKTLAGSLPRTVRRSALDEEIAHACGWKASRARDVRSVVTYYPDQIDDEFPALSFSHFRSAMSAGTLDRSLEWLGWCLSSADDYGGMVAGVDVLAAKMQEKGDKVAMPVWEKWLEQLSRLVTKIYRYSETPEDIKKKIYRLMEVYENEFGE